MKNRFDYVDIAKGLGIMLVIMGHIEHNYVPFCGSVHIPLFFVLSGYVYSLEKGSERPFGKVAGKRALRLLIPYLIYNFVLYAKYILKMVLSEGFNAKECVDAFLGFMYSASILYKNVPSENNFNGFVFGNGPLWFLTAMAISSVIFYGINYFLLKHKFDIKKLLLSSAVLIAVSWCLCTFLPVYLPWSFEMALLGTVFMQFGMCLRQRNVIENIIKKPYMLIGNVVLFVVLHAFNGSANLAIGVYGKSMIIYILLGMLSSIVVIYIAYLISKIELLNKVLSYIGQNTLFILAFHMTIISIVIGVLNKLNLESLVEWWGLFIITFPAGLIGCVVLIEIIVRVFKVPRKYL